MLASSIGVCGLMGLAFNEGAWKSCRGVLMGGLLDCIEMVDGGFGMLWL